MPKTGNAGLLKARRRVILKHRVPEVSERDWQAAFGCYAGGINQGASLEPLQEPIRCAGAIPTTRLMKIV
jgi:hypothetical protein